MLTFAQFKEKLMKNRLFENSFGLIILVIVGIGLAILTLLLVYMFILIFTPLLVPAILIFLPKMNKLLAGIIGTILFIYYVFEIKLGWPSSQLYFFDITYTGVSQYNSGLIGMENLIYINILNYIGLGLSLFMIYLYVDKKKIR